MHLQENALFDLGVMVTQKVAQYPLHHVTYEAAKLAVATSNCLGGDAFTRQVAQWATIAHHGARIMFGDTIIYNAQRQITLSWNEFKNIRYYAGSSYLQVLKRSE